MLYGYLRHPHKGKPMRGRKPLAKEVHKQQGSYVKNPQRENKAAPVAPRDAPDMPETIQGNAVAARKWHDLIRMLDSMKILSSVDADLLEQYCITYSMFSETLAKVRQTGVVFVEKTDDGVNVKRNQFTTELHKFQDRLTKLMAELGLTPSSRSRLHAQEVEQDDNPFTELLARLGRG